MSHTVQTVEQYQLLIEEDLLDLVQQAIALESSVHQEEDYSDKKCALENKLYDLYQEIGWSVVYKIKELPF